MSFTVGGAVIFIFAIWVFLTRPAQLSYYVVFFAPFSGTAVVNATQLSYKSGGVGLMPAALFLLLLLMSRFIRGSIFRPVKISNGHFVQLLAIGGLTAALLFSLGVNASLRGLTSAQITQSAYVLFGIIATVAISLELIIEDAIESLVRAARAAAIFVSFWGLLQFACFMTGLPYPAFLFNNSLSDSADMFSQDLGGSFMRIASVAVEPSFFATSLLHFAAFGATILLYEPRLRTRFWIFPVGLSLFLLLLSTSTTAYLGLAVLAGLLFLARPASVLVAGAPVAALFAALIAFVPKFAAVLESVTVDKTTTVSYLDRTARALQAWHLFLDYPFIGRGWGFESSNWNAMTTMLCYSGLLGTVAFFIAAGSTLFELGSATRRQPVSGEGWRLAAYAVGVRNALIVSFACAVSSGIKYVVLDDWCFWGLGIAISSKLVLDRAGGPSLVSMAAPGSASIRNNASVYAG